MNIDQNLKTLTCLADDFEVFTDYCKTLMENTADIEDFHITLETKNPDLTHYPGDRISTMIIPDIIGEGHKVALKSLGDGNCLFNSASIVLVGDESLSNELRLRTVIELATNFDFYASHPHYLNKELKTLDGKSSYKLESLYDISAFGKEASSVFSANGFNAAVEKEITITSINAKYCGVLQICALASVIGIPINMVYPQQTFHLLSIFQGEIKPRIESTNERKITILWTNTNGWSGKTFVANHFVPLIVKYKSILPIPAVQQPGQRLISSFRKRKIDEKKEDDDLPFMMNMEWYAKVGRNDQSNNKRGMSRKDSTLDSLNFDSLKTAVQDLNRPQKTSIHLKVVALIGEYLIDNGPLVPTLDVIKQYQMLKKLSPSSKMKAKAMLEILRKHLPVCHLYLDRKAYMFENRLKDVIESIKGIMTQSTSQTTINEHVAGSIGEIYKDVLNLMDTKRDRDTMKGVLAHITSIRFASKLGGVSSRLGVRNAKQSLLGNLVELENISTTSLTVRSDLTCKQQQKYHQRIIAQRKFKEMKVIAAGRGAHMKCEEFPELAVLLENVFAESGLESHPRLTDDILYRATNNAMTMTKAREVLLALAPKNFTISLSTCFNYTQNFKAGTAQARRHHEGKNVNACISLHAPPRIGVEKPSPNLHWTSSNVKLMLSDNEKNTIFDSKDAKAIVCADISPVQRPGKTWKKRSGILLDHEWNQSRVNAVTPMAHLFLDDKRNVSNASVVRSGKASVLVNLSYFESSSTFRCFNEFFKLLVNPSLVKSFERKPNHLKENLVNIVDNGPGEAPSSPLVQMLLIRTRKFLRMKSVCQVSFSEYHSKRNFVERVHSQENSALSRHGKFSSTMVHQKQEAGSQQHKENMEAMATKVIKCISTASFGGLPISCERGIKDEEQLFDDEEALKTFLSLSEKRKKAYTQKYIVRPGKLLSDLCFAWNIEPQFEGSYYEDYLDLISSWKDKYTFYNAQQSAKNPQQPIPDYVHWIQTGELHYLQNEDLLYLGSGSWDRIPALFLPSQILEMLFDTLIAPLNGLSDETMTAISILVWMPVDEVRQYFTTQALAKEENLSNEVSRHKLRQFPLYGKKKHEIAKIAKERGIDFTGTKLDVAKRVAVAQGLKLDDKPLYNGRIRSIPKLSSNVRNLGIATLKSILSAHNLPIRGSKDELVLHVCLLRADRGWCICKNQRSALLQLIKTAQIIMSKVIALRKTNNNSAKKRTFESLQESSLSMKDPRKAASACNTYVKSKIAVPTWISESNMHEVFTSLKMDLLATCRPSDQPDEEENGMDDVNEMPVDEYEQYFEIGARVEVRWGKGDLAKSGWRAGWFVAEVQDFSLENDWIKVEYISEEGSVYKIPVKKYLDDGILRLKNPIF